MSMPICARCKKNMAVVFITKIENGTSVNEGLCLKCAKELGIKPVNDLVEKMGISDEELETMSNQLMDVAQRIRNMRDILGYSIQKMAELTEISPAQYQSYETGTVDLPFTFIHKCAKTYGMEITELLEGYSAHLSNYAVTRRGKGITTAKEDGINIANLAPKFRNKIAQPYWVRYEYDPQQQNKPQQPKQQAKARPQGQTLQQEDGTPVSGWVIVCDDAVINAFLCGVLDTDYVENGHRFLVDDGTFAEIIGIVKAVVREY